MLQYMIEWVGNGIGSGWRCGGGCLEGYIQISKFLPIISIRQQMRPVSKCQQIPAGLDKFRLLSALLKSSYYHHSLEHCFPASRTIDQALQNPKSKLTKQLKQIEANSEDETMEGYFGSGSQELGELTQYYKYYTQTSILHQPSFFNIMHHHREQQKACHYNKFKALLDLSNSTQNVSEEPPKADKAEASFLLLPQLSITPTNCEESLLIQKLKNKLQKDFGPNQYQTLQEIDKQYIFTKKIKIVPSPAKKTDKHSLKYTKEDSATSLKKRLQKKRNNTCDAELFFTHNKNDSQCKIRRKKNASMASLGSLGKNTPVTRQSSFKCTKTLLDTFGGQEASKENQVKCKILGVKERIRQQKSELLKKSEVGKQRKQVERVGRRPRH